MDVNTACRGWLVGLLKEPDQNITAKVIEFPAGATALAAA